MTTRIPTRIEIDDMTEAQRKVFENRLRRAAQRQGLQLDKCRRRDPLARDHNTFEVVDLQTGHVVCDRLGGYGLSLADVARYLYGFLIYVDYSPGTSLLTFEQAHGDPILAFYNTTEWDLEQLGRLIGRPPNTMHLPSWALTFIDSGDDGKVFCEHLIAITDAAAVEQATRQSQDLLSRRRYRTPPLADVTLSDLDRWRRDRAAKYGC